MLLKLVCLTLVLSICNGQRLVGDRRPVNLVEEDKSEEIKRIATYAVSEIQSERLKKSNDRTQLQLIRVVNAHSQVVSGTNYFITFRIKQSNCKTKCAIETCEVQVYDQPWTNTRRLEKYECNSEKPRHLQINVPSNQQRPGPGPSNLQMSEMDYVKRAVSDSNAALNSHNYYKLVRFSIPRVAPGARSVTVEVDVGETNCPVNDPLASNCPEIGNRRKCFVSLNVSTPRIVTERVACQ